MWRYTRREQLALVSLLIRVAAGASGICESAQPL